MLLPFAHEREIGIDVDAVHALPFLIAQTLDAAPPREDARIEHQHVESTEGLDASIERVRKLVSEGAVGQVYMMKQSEKHSGPHSDWFYDVNLSGGGVLIRETWPGFVTIVGMIALFGAVALREFHVR